MKQYLDIVKTTLDKGKRQANRTGIDTFAVPNQHFSHDMRDGFPLLTTKKMPIKTLAVELEGFIGGITDKKWFQERGCKIWNEWANPKVVSERLANHTTHTDGPIKNLIQSEVNDLGPIYGYQWRRFGRNYTDPITEKFEPATLADGDQLGRIVDMLHSNPDDRRLVCSAWNPLDIPMMGLPACHVMFVLTHIEGELSLHWTQRSCDLMLGVPFNIASYAILLELLAKEGGFTAANLSGMLCNCHIYENQLEGAREQVSRSPQQLPNLTITNFKSIFDWTHKDIELSGYNPLDKINFGGVAV